MHPVVIHIEWTDAISSAGFVSSCSGHLHAVVVDNSSPGLQFFLVNSYNLANCKILFLAVMVRVSYNTSRHCSIYLPKMYFIFLSTLLCFLGTTHRCQLWPLVPGLVSATSRMFVQIQYQMLSVKDKYKCFKTTLSSAILSVICSVMHQSK